jgi:hypothetical protein
VAKALVGGQCPPYLTYRYNATVLQERPHAHPLPRSASRKIGRDRRHPCLERLETRELLTTYTVINTNDSGGGSLRHAINLSNADTARANVITFDIGGTGIQTISLLSALPPITQAVTIEGPTGTAGVSQVRLDGSGAGTTAAGLAVQADNTTIEGLSIGGFGGDGIDVSGTGDVIAGNQVGIPRMLSGTGNGGWGVAIAGSNDQVVVSSAGFGNFIRGNSSGGVLIAGSGATGNVVQGNNIGLVFANAGVGVLIEGQASGNRVSTNGDGMNDLQGRNVIATNGSWGVEISGAGTENNTVAGNSIGTDGTGGAASPNVDGGVLISGGTLYYGDTYSVITGESLSTATGAAATAGAHPITATGGAAANYSITDADGTLTVTAPPPATLTGVTPTRNRKHQASQVVVAFSGILDLGERATGSYRLVIAGKKNSFTARNAKVIALKSAVYDATRNTVTLTPSRPFALSRPVQLQVEGQTALV